MSLGPVVRNVFKHEHAEPPKPHLDARLEEGDVRYNALGAIVNTGGKLTFRPAYAGERPAVLPTPYKEPAYVPFQGENAYLDPAPMQRGKPVKITNIPTFSADFNPNTSPLQVGDRVKQVLKVFKNYNGLATVEEVTETHYILKWDDGVKNPGNTKWHKNAERHCFEIVAREGVTEGAPATAATARRLTKGDKVCMAPDEVEFLRSAICMPDNKVRQIIKDRLVGVIETDDGSDVPYVVRFKFPDGTEKSFWTKEHRLVPAEAAPAKQDWDPLTSPLQVGDLVEITEKGNMHFGQRGRVTAVNGHFWTIAGMGPWDRRSYMKIVDRPTK